MKKIETVSLVGLGAIGCAYLSRIAQVLPPENVRVIADKKRAEKYKNGVSVNGKNYQFTVADPEDSCEPADLLIFAVKFNQLGEAIEEAKNHVGSETLILSFLNGVTSEELIGARYGMEKLLYSISVGIDAVRVNTSVCFHSLGTVSFGEKKNAEGQYSEKVLRVRELFERAGINYSIPEDMMRTLWWKFMVNVGINQTSAVVGGPYGVFQNVPVAHDLMESAMEEVVALTAKAGVNLTRADIEDWNGMLEKLSPVGKTSMLQDIEAGRQTEVNIFAGTVVDLGARYGVPTPVNSTLLKIIQSMEGKFKYRKNQNKSDERIGKYGD